MVITDIKNCKIRVESEEHSKAIQKAAFELGFSWLFGKGFFPKASLFIFFEEDEVLTQCQTEKVFIDTEEKEIFFYDNNFHDEPQSTTKAGMEAMNSTQEQKLATETSETLIQFSGERVDDIKDAAVSKLLEIGYEFHGEWLSKEEIENKKRDEFIGKLSNEILAKTPATPRYDVIEIEKRTCMVAAAYIYDAGYRKGEL